MLKEEWQCVLAGAKYSKKAARVLARRKRGAGDEKKALLKKSKSKAFPPKTMQHQCNRCFQGRLEEELMSTRLREVQKLYFMPIIRFVAIISFLAIISFVAIIIFLAVIILMQLLVVWQLFYMAISVLWKSLVLRQLFTNHENYI